MADVDVLLERYGRAVDGVRPYRANEVDAWPLADATEFNALRIQLKPHPEAGNPYCQYALASIEMMGYYCESEE